MAVDNPKSQNPSIVRATTANLVGMLLPLILQIVTIPIYLTLIGPSRYGALSLVWLLLGYFGLFDLGFGRAIASRIAQMHDQSGRARARVFWTGTLLSFLTGSVGGLFLFAIGRTLFSSVLNLPPDLQLEAQEALPWVAATLPVATTISALSGALQGRQEFVALNLAQSTGMILYQVAPLLIAITVSQTMPWLIVAAISGRLVSVGMLFFFCMRAMPEIRVLQMDSAEIRPMLVYGGWFTITAVIDPLLTVFDRFVIGAMIGVEAVAIYSIPFTIVLRIGVFPASWQNALFPRYAMVSAEDSHRLLVSSVKCQVWMMTPIVVFGMLLIGPFISVWINPSFATSAAPVGQVLLLGLWLVALACVPYSLLQSRGRPDIPAKFHAIELCFYAPAVCFLIWQFGLVGAAWAWSLRLVLDTVLLFSATGALNSTREARWGFLWVCSTLGWVTFDSDNTALYWSVSALLACSCAFWTWRSIPREVLRLMPMRVGQFFPNNQ